MKARREFVPIAKMAGKTIERAYQFEGHDDLVLTYTDGGYTMFRNGYGFKDTSIDYYYDDCFTDKQFIEMGLYAAEDIDEYRRKVDEERAAQQREADLKEFERLKKKLGITG